MELDVQNIVKKYNSSSVIDNVSFTLHQGIYGLLGPNGSGKSTLIRMICGIEMPDSGKICLDGKEIGELDERYRDVLGYVPQKAGYYPDFTAERFLQYMAAVKGLEEKAAKERIREVLEIVELTNAGRKKIKHFSGGMKQRLCIAQGILNRPEILILDEPTVGLDLKERVNFKQFISEYASERIVIFSTHIVSDIEDIGNEIIFLKEGRVQIQGKPDELLSAIEGKVWECECTKAEADAIRRKYKVSNMRINSGQVNLRVVSEERPNGKAVIVEGDLQDLYLYFFDKPSE